jgi:hypothetical protein
MKFVAKKVRLRIAVEVDGGSSLNAEIESGRGAAIVREPF